MPVDAYLAHIVSRIQDDMNFLVSQGAISQNDARIITDRLPSAYATPATMPTPSIPTPVISPNSYRGTPTAPPMRNFAPPPSSRAPSQLRARALWAYNENGQEADDLSFSAGEVITVLEETNADWWKGKNTRGEVGLFPANYVEKLSADPQPATVSPPLPGRMVAPIPQEKSGYGYAAVPPPPPEVQVAEGQEQPKKKGKLGKLGNTMAQSAAGGVGFGAGAAIGSGIVNAIF